MKNVVAVFLLVLAFEVHGQETFTMKVAKENPCGYEIYNDEAFINQTEGSGTLIGSVKTNEGLPLSCARLTIQADPERSLQTVTDSLGHYKFKGILYGKYTMLVEHPQYETAQVSNVQIMIEKITFQDFVLAPVAATKNKKKKKSKK